MPITEQTYRIISYSHKTAKATALVIGFATPRYLIRQEDGTPIIDSVSGNVIETDDISYALAAQFTAGGVGSRIVDRLNWRQSPLTLSREG